MQSRVVLPKALRRMVGARSFNDIVELIEAAKGAEIAFEVVDHSARRVRV